MGNAQQIAKKVLLEPATEEELTCSRAVNLDPNVRHWMDTLLKGNIPTNFSYQDMCEYLSRACSASFVMIPIWTFQLKTVSVSAKSLINAWPSWTDEQVSDPIFLRGIRLMFPLFKVGLPIGHARFMFYDDWSPQPMESINKETEQWMQVVLEFLPIPEVARMVVQGYEGLCPSRARGEWHHLKIIDSIPASARALQADVQAFHDVVAQVMDDTWEHKCRQDGFDRKLRHARAFFSAVLPPGRTCDGSIETTLLPSTQQKGLECIIISLCRVISTFCNPILVPCLDCQPLCVEKRGRRIVAQVLSLIHEHYGRPLEDQPPAVPESAPMEVSGNDGEGNLELPNHEREVNWFVVYEQPQLKILAPNPEYVPHEVKFNGQVGYTVYRDCKWIHVNRNQDFTPSTPLMLDGKVGCSYICPVRHVVDRRWLFAVLGRGGYTLLPAKGRMINGSIISYRDGSAMEPAVASTSPDPQTHGTFDEFLARLIDPTWSTNSGASTLQSSQDEAMTDAADITMSTPESKRWRRRSSRVRKPRVLLIPSDTSVKVIVALSLHVV